MRAAAQSAVRAGFEVVAYDLFADKDLRAIAQVKQAERYPHDAREWLAQQDVDGWMYTGAWENYPELVDELAAIRPLWGNPARVIRAVRDPLALQEVCHRHGISFPETISTPATVPAGGWLHKTYRGASGIGVKVAAEGIHFQTGFLQRQLSGVAHSAVYVAAGGACRLAGITEQILGNRAAGRPFQYAGSFSPAPRCTLDLWKRMENVGEVLAAEFALVGLFGVDFVLKDKDPHIIEINPRYTASMEVVEKLNRPASVGAHIAACHQLELPAAKDFVYEHTKWLKNIFFAERPLKMVDAHQIAFKAENPMFGDQYADVSAVGTEFRPGDPVVTLILPYRVEPVLPGDLLEYKTWLPIDFPPESLPYRPMPLASVVGFVGGVQSFLHLADQYQP